MTNQLRRATLLATIFVFGGLTAALAQAGVFNTYRFVEPGDFAFGGEVELALTDGAGVGGNARVTHGLNEFMNAAAIIGTGGGSRHFRVGGNLTFDFFPDMEGQPGMGVAVQTIYYRLENAGQLDSTLIPYVHKAFFSEQNELEPFLALPIGLAFSGGKYKAISSFVVGSGFKASEHVRFSMEFGIAINNTQSYLSAGVTYYH